MIRIGISGVCGKMGKRIAALTLQDLDIQLKAALEREGIAELGEDLGLILGTNMVGVMVRPNLERVCKDIDVLIEFTLPDATLEHLEICASNKIPMVIGTTGIDQAGEEKIKKAAKKIPIVFSPNMAIGVNVLFKIVKEAAPALGTDFDIKVDETHHIHKKDSPSGTAKKIAQIISDSVGKEPPIEAFREGEAIGNHGIVFDNKYETLEIRHNAKTRDVFAAGAIRAAKFVIGKRPGLYSMADVLGIGYRV